MPRKKAIVHVPAEVRERVEAEVQRCLDIAEDRFGRTFAFPVITYDLRGRTAGKAFVQDNLIQLNSVLLMENLDTFIDGRTGRGTVTHEVAHIVDYIGNNGFRVSRRGKHSLHGAAWQRVMRMFGVRNPSRCHSYDTTNARVRTSAKHEYRCNGCGEVMELGPKQHKKQQNRMLWRPGSKTLYWKRGCGHHAKRTGYTYLGVKGQPQQPMLKAADKPKPKAKTGTKKEKAIATYREFSHMPKDFIISKIANACDMSWQGATTYYYTARKEA